jgi:hypothetical protein
MNSIRDRAASMVVTSGPPQRHQFPQCRLVDLDDADPRRFEAGDLVPSASAT